MTEKNLKLIMEIAKEHAPREMCGLLVIIKGEEYFKLCKNIKEGTDGFILDPEDFAEAEDSGDIIAVVHSHPNRDTSPSDADLAGIETSGLKWIIVNPFTNEVTEI